VAANSKEREGWRSEQQQSAIHGHIAAHFNGVVNFDAEPA
jgi:hypothetical protein